MKLEIFYQNSGLKKDTSKGLEHAISALRVVLASNLKNNAHFAGVKQVSLSLTLCGKSKMRRLNREYRQKDYVTDVLSFPVYDNLRFDKSLKKSHQKLLPQVDLGDLVICKEKAKSQASEFKISFEEEIIHLAIHGYLHLLGFDHEISSREEKIMETYEQELVGKVYKKLKRTN